MLVVAKAPVPGRVKTRLGRDVGMDAAAALAAASLLDTLEACAATGADCHLSLAGDLDGSVGERELRAALTGWAVHPQEGADFAARLTHAHSKVGSPVVQVGMDTPHVTAELLLDAAAGLTTYDAVLGPAEDGGWWVLALNDPSRAVALAGVPMSTPATGAATRGALEGAGLSVGTTATLRDVDTVADADVVAALAPGSRFAAAWATARERSLA